jgi:hypothetical protein
MRVAQNISNDARLTFSNAFYCLLILTAWPGRLGLISKRQHLWWQSN